uniref:monocarboxylate transporter 12-like isoform X2 n=1 Tax=Myxine glutinosa TaxID=7769 RepID=UPI00358EEC92
MTQPPCAFVVCTSKLVTDSFAQSSEEDDMSKEGGWSWVILAASFIISMCTRAMTRTLSIFLVEFTDHFDQDLASVSWVISINDCLTMACAPLGTFLVSRFSYKATVMLGGILCTSGYVLGSFCTSIVQLYICLGVLSGLGSAFCFPTCVALVGCYFPHRRSFATGLATLGIGVGTFVLGSLAQFLIEAFGWRGALLILGGLVTHTLLCAFLFRPPPAVAAKRKDRNLLEPKDRLKEQVLQYNSCKPLPQQVDLESPLFNLEFVVFAFALFFLIYGSTPAIAYMFVYAYDSGVSKRQAAFLVSIYGIMTIIGNVFYSWIMDKRFLRLYQMHTFMPVMVMYGISILLIPAASTYPLLMVCAVLLGHCEGILQPGPPVLASKLVGPTLAPTAIGIVYFSYSLPYLISLPISAWITNATSGYTAAFLLNGFFVLFGGVIFQFSLLYASCCKGRSYGPKVYECLLAKYCKNEA